MFPCLWLRFLTQFPQIARNGPNTFSNRYNLTLRWSWQCSMVLLDVKYGAELLLLFPSPWSRVFGSSFSKIAIMPKIPKKQIKLNPEMALRTWVMPCLKVNYEVGEFPKLSYCPKYPRTDLTLPSDSLVPGLRLHLIWHIELRFLDYFVCVPAYDLWYFDLVSPNCAMSQIP